MVVMVDAVAQEPKPRKHSGATVTDMAAGLWLAVAIAGQVAFAAYLIGFYAFPAILGDIAAWNVNVVLSQPPVHPDRPQATLAFGVHAIGAAALALMGGLQLIPMVRNRFRTFHRWNGRAFLLLIVALTVSGYYLTWFRGSPPNSFNEFGTSVNGLLILAFAAMIVTAAMRRRVAQHERWAVRLFLVANAQWFVRIGGFGYFVTMQTLGYSVPFDGAFFQFWIWGSFLVPLAMAELYFRTRSANSAVVRWSSALAIFIVTPMTLIGIVTFSLFTIQLMAGNVQAG